MISAGIIVLLSIAYFFTMLAIEKHAYVSIYKKEVAKIKTEYDTALSEAKQSAYQLGYDDGVKDVVSLNIMYMATSNKALELLRTKRFTDYKR